MAEQGQGNRSPTDYACICPFILKRPLALGKIQPTDGILHGTAGIHKSSAASPMAAARLVPKGSCLLTWQSKVVAQILVDVGILVRDKPLRSGRSIQLREDDGLRPRRVGRIILRSIDDLALRVLMIYRMYA